MPGRHTWVSKKQRSGIEAGPLAAGRKWLKYGAVVSAPLSGPDDESREKYINVQARWDPDLQIQKSQIGDY